MSDAGSDRGGRRPFEQGDGKVRDFTNWERKGPLSPAMAAAPSLREGGRQRSKDGPGFRKSSPAWGEGTGRSQDGSRPPRREYQEKPPVERAPTAPELDNQWRSKMRPDAPAKSPTPSRDPSNPPSPAPAPVPASRPKLNLQKRTVSEAEPGASPATSTSTSESKASPFGAARPVDTSAKEKEIEEKRQIAIRQRREAEEKAKAEKVEEKRLAREAKDKALAEKGSKDASPEVEKENGAEKPPGGKNFEILQRASEDANGMTADEDGTESDAAIVPTDDKAVKPREIVRDPPSSKPQEAGWRGQNAQERRPSTDDTASQLNEGGWSTVSNTKQRNSKRGNQAARAIAS
jgi:translation initiation factor 4B